ncbi:MAG: helix-turn-helix domain-containing protein [Rhizomicrobium sp.]|jgi:predicted DNA-binding transcriptional regulator
MRIQAAKTLESLGFSEIESLIYCFLLEASPATGYRISHAIGKPTANTYKAIAALTKRGAIAIDDSANRLCRAVPPSELLDRIDRDFTAHKDRAEKFLSRIRPAKGDDRVYQLTDVDQVLERARSMIAGTKSAVLVDAFPKVVTKIAPSLESAAGRGVDVVVRVYAPVALKRVKVLLAPDAGPLISLWPGEQLNMVADAEQFMLALLAKDAGSVHQAIWSNSTFLSCMQHNGLWAELVMTETFARDGIEPPSDIRRISLTRSQLPGLRQLMKRYAER